jgi:acetyl-CoA carboxylase carboxyl transferase subunit beta
MPEFLNDRKDRLDTYRKNFRKKKSDTTTPIAIPEGLFIPCEACQAAIFQRDLDKNDGVCPQCGYHFRIGAGKRLTITLDAGSFVEFDADLLSKNPLHMPDYETKLAAGKLATQMNDAFVGGIATIAGIKLAIGVLDSTFMMGSMGSVVGEKVTRLVERATKSKLPLVIFSASGGARMQEGILSLMQMAKTSASLALFHEAGLLYVSVLTNPTTGGVAASFASLGDIKIAEKSSLIGFAGPRVIKQTIQQELPAGFQTDAFQLQHGQVDLIVDRHQMKTTLAKILKFHGKGR